MRTTIIRRIPNPNRVITPPPRCVPTVLCPDVPNEIGELQDLRPATVEGQHGHDAALVKTHIVGWKLPGSQSLVSTGREQRPQAELPRRLYLRGCNQDEGLFWPLSARLEQNPAVMPGDQDTAKSVCRSQTGECGRVRRRSLDHTESFCAGGHLKLEGRHPYLRTRQFKSRMTQNVSKPSHTARSFCPFDGKPELEAGVCWFDHVAPGRTAS